MKKKRTVGSKYEPMAAVESRKVSVLKGCQFLLHTIFLCKRNGFHIRSIKLPRLFFHFIVLLPIDIVILLLIWFCVDAAFELKIISFPVNVVLGFLQMQMIYTSLAIWNDSIFDTMDHLQRIVDQSKLSFC